jgi:integrase
MPRQVRELNLSTREARKRIAPRGKPYYRGLDEGLHLGYRRGQSAGAWVIRMYLGNGAYEIATLEGRPDDVLAADGVTVLNWSQAQSVARQTYQDAKRQAAGLSDQKTASPQPDAPYTVADALSDYMLGYKRNGGKAERRVEVTINALVIPALGATEVAKLTREAIEKWLDKLAAAPPRLRTKKTEEQKFRDKDESPEGLRRRKSSANRVLTILKAALNRAYDARKVSSDDGWRSVKSFREVDAARIRYLNDDESKRLVSACEPDFRPMIQAGLLTGCRYGELTALRVDDFDQKVGTIHVRFSKSGKPRHVVLTEEGQRFFKSSVDGKCSADLIFQRSNQSAWGANHQQRRITAAYIAAGLEPLTFHELRHTYASRMVVAGAPLPVVARQLGHADTRMVEKHYAHLAPNFVADTVRATFKPIGILPDNETSEARSQTDTDTATFPRAC